MPTITTASPVETPLYRAIVKEILAGLRNESTRRDDAEANRQFYSGDFSAYSPRRGDNRHDTGSYLRTSLVMQRVVDSLTDLLYREGPKRTLKPPVGGPETDYQAASAWLEAVYKKNHVNAKLQEADRFSHISDVAAFQAIPCEDPDCPVEIRLWDASEFYVWCEPGNPIKATAVAVRDVYDLQRRLRLYTAATVTEFRTKRLEGAQTSGGTAYSQVGIEVNELGLLPFAFFPFRIPSRDFWTPGPGNHLRQFNDWVNKRLTDLFDTCRINLDPILLLQNVRENFTFPPAKPGIVVSLPGTGDALRDAAGGPDAKFLQCDSSFVAAGWDDLGQGIDHDLEMIGVAPAQIRMTQQVAASGASIQSEQIQPVKHAEGRQAVAAFAEDGLCQLVLTAGAKHLGSQEVDEYTVTARQLETVAAAPGLTLHWPSLYPRVPGVEQDQNDLTNLDAKLTSRTEILAQRCKLTDEEATAKLEKIAEQLKAEQKLFADLDEAAVNSALMAVGKHPKQLAAQQDEEEPDDDDGRKPKPEPDDDDE